MLELSNLSLPLDAALEGGQNLIRLAVAEALEIKPQDIKDVRIIKRSVDARKKQNVHFVATVALSLIRPTAELRVLACAEERGGKGATPGTHVRRFVAYTPLSVTKRVLEPHEPVPVVVGSGPAGLFAALYLARAGLKPLLVERGARVDERVSLVRAFDRGGQLSERGNIQFGEGGAGTFSDGKLTTNIKNPLAKHVLHWLVKAGAPEEVLWQAKPHIGTDRLIKVVRSLTEQIEALGGRVCFNTKLSQVFFKHGQLKEIQLSHRFGRTTRLPVRRLVLAPGHSARDTFCMLHEAGMRMEQKPFSVGVRIEHRQEAINRAQYGAAAAHPALAAADYQFAVHLKNGRSVYTFCMCPGGEVVCAASEQGGVVVNGMSRYARDGENANSALLVGVTPQDFGSNHPLAGMLFQRRMEQAAFQAALASGVAYAAPVQRVGDFLGGSAGKPRTDVVPTYARGVCWCDLHGCLPDFVSDAIAQALPVLDRKMRGFADAGAVMTGVETRSSSPVRLVRNHCFQAEVLALPPTDARCASWREGSDDLANCEGSYDLPATSQPVLSNEVSDASATSKEGSGVYPCGEGAGYAGGIMSAACDGLRVAQALSAQLRRAE